jgi:hypothetical protein
LFQRLLLERPTLMCAFLNRVRRALCRRLASVRQIWVLLDQSPQS